MASTAIRLRPQRRVRVRRHPRRHRPLVLRDDDPGLDLPRVDWAALWPLLLIGSVPGSCSARSAAAGDDRT